MKDFHFVCKKNVQLQYDKTIKFHMVIYDLCLHATNTTKDDHTTNNRTELRNCNFYELKNYISTKMF